MAHRVKLVEDEGEVELAKAKFWAWTEDHQDTDEWEAKRSEIFEGLSERFGEKGGPPALVKARDAMMKRHSLGSQAQVIARGGLLKVQQITAIDKRAIKRDIETHDFDGARRKTDAASNMLGPDGVDQIHGIIDQREAIVLRMWSGLSFEEIAELTGKSTSTAHRRYLAGLDTLRKHWTTACQDQESQPK